MRTARTVVCSLRLLSAAFVPALAGQAAAAPLIVLATGALLVACDDENDPKTWVKRLDDPAQRGNAIKRLTQFYEDGMTKASNDAQAPEIKSLLDTIVDPLTKTYTAGGLDDKTRVDLMKFLAETHDARTQPALAKALTSFEMGKTDDETRVACESKTDQDHAVEIPQFPLRETGDNRQAKAARQHIPHWQGSGAKGVSMYVHCMFLSRGPTRSARRDLGASRSHCYGQTGG